MDNLTGQVISHYLIQEKLGEGGMGVVYKAEDTKLKRKVAIKFLPSEVAAKKGERQRFKIEARASAALNHPNITTIYAIEEVDEIMFIVMEYIEGKELSVMIEKGHLKLDEMIPITCQIAEGLQIAHEKNIVHRDIKSSNIMLTQKNQVKIMDFGLAKFTGVSKLTKTGTTVGTIGYMSPEQIQGSEIDHRSDLWSFGVLLYEMLTGELPFQGDYEASIIYKILNEEPRAIQQFRSDVPDSVVDLVAQLLQRDPANRLSSAQEIIKRLTSDEVKKQPSKEKKKSIAVLYFENMSSDKENEYFCAGMTEDLIIDLSKIQRLRVIPRSDVLPFRGKEVHSRQVGEALGVHYILEGSVRKGGNKIRITAQLIDVRSGFQLWADRYDRLLEDIFDVQIEVSEKIAEALKVSLTESEKQSLVKKPTDDLRAYDFYMRGSEFLLRKGNKNNEAAIQMFEHALSIDPNFTMAYVGLAEACSYNYIFYDGDRTWLEKTIEYNEKALMLEPNLIEAQFGIGMVYAHQKRYADAIQSFKNVLKIKKDFYPAYFWSGIVAWVTKDYDVSVRFYQKAVEIKSYSEEPYHYLDMTYRQMGNLEAAQKVQKKVIELGERKLEVNPESVTTLSRIAIAYATMNYRNKALCAVDKIKQIASDDGVALYNCACTYAILGKKQEAFNYFEAALKMGFINIADWIPGDPYLKSIRDDPKFKKIISRYLQ